MDVLFEMELQEIDEIMEEDTQEKERFRIENLEAANWAFRKLAAIERKRKEIQELANKEIERIKAWQEREERGLDNSKEFFEGLLTEYFAREREKDPKFKISTPYGKVSARKQQPKWHYDEEKLIEWLKENNKDLLRVKYEPDKNEIKRVYKVVGTNVVTDDGEIVEGITVEERPEKVTIKVVE
jgi:hypothetical protein